MQGSECGSIVWYGGQLITNYTDKHDELNSRSSHFFPLLRIAYRLMSYYQEGYICPYHIVQACRACVRASPAQHRHSGSESESRVQARVPRHRARGESSPSNADIFELESKNLARSHSPNFFFFPPLHMQKQRSVPEEITLNYPHYTTPHLPTPTHVYFFFLLAHAHSH